MATSRRFAEPGHAVAMVARDAEKLGPLIGEITDGGGVARAYAADATEDHAVTRTFERAEAELGPANFAVYNVGIRVHGPMIERDTGEFKAVWRDSCLGGMIVGR